MKLLLSHGRFCLKNRVISQFIDRKTGGTVMLSKFLIWARQKKDFFKNKNWIIKIIENEITENPSARLDIDTSTLISRITFWESGNAFSEIISIETEEMLYCQHIETTQDQSFDEYFSSFFEILESR